MRKLCLFAVPFGAAALLCCLLLPTAGLPLLAALCAGGALLSLLLRGDARTRSVLVCLGCGAGLLWFWGWHAAYAAPGEAFAGTRAKLTAQVCGYPEESKLGVRVPVLLETPDGTVRTMLYADGEFSLLQPGDEVTGTLRTSRSDRFGSEESSYFTTRGIFLLAYAGEDLTWTRPEKMPLRYLPLSLTHRLSCEVKKLYSNDTQGLMLALVAGDKSAMGDDLRSGLSRAGLSHIAVVSGMHVSLLAGFIGLLTGKRRRRTALATIPLLLLYAAMMGQTPSVVRAVVMAVIVLLAPVLKREGDGPTSLSLALLLLTMANPYCVAGVSFQLSFGATAGILLVTERANRALWNKVPKARRRSLSRPARGALNYLFGTLATTAGALIFTVPLTALYFGSVSLIAPLSNLLCLWAVTAVFLLGVCSAVLGLFSGTLGAVLAFPAQWLARYLLWVTSALGRLSYAAVRLDAVYFRVWLAAVLLMAGALLVMKGKKRPVAPVCCGVLTFCAAACFTRASLTTAPLTVTALDVGQGQSVAFLTGGDTALVDCGGSGTENAGDTAADYFQSLGVSTLNALILTHFDDDHYNGVEELFARMKIETVFIPNLNVENGCEVELLDIARRENCTVYTVSEAQRAEVGESTFVLYPPMGDGGNNEEGLMALCSTGDYDVLMTGDASDFVEKMLVKYYKLPDIELLVAGHHGSKHSTCQELLDAARPESAVISVGENDYGHPAQETLDRLTRAGAAVYRTDLMGNITFTIRGEQDGAETEN